MDATAAAIAAAESAGAISAFIGVMSFEVATFEAGVEGMDERRLSVAGRDVCRAFS